MAIYDKRAWELVENSLEDLPEVFTTNEMFEWFDSKYPKIKTSSVRVYLAGMSVNSLSRRHYDYLQDHGVLYKVDRTRYTRYKPDVHGQFDQEGRPLDREDTLGDEDENQALTEEQSEFAMEVHLEDFMQKNWQLIDLGRPLKIWTDSEGTIGRQYPTDVGPIDFLCQDSETGDFVVIELKKGRTSDKVLGQTQRYMGWVKRNLVTGNESVFGLIIANEVDEHLQYGLEVAPNISAKLYRVEFRLVEHEVAKE